MFEVKNKYNEKTVFYQGKRWIPIESTMIDKGFLKSWNKAYKLYNEIKNKNIKTTFELLSKYKPLSFPVKDTFNFTINYSDLNYSYFKEIDKINTFLK